MQVLYLIADVIQADNCDLSSDKSESYVRD